MSPVSRKVTRIGLVICFGAFAISSPVVAADVWNCTYKDQTNILPRDTQDEAIIRIEDKWLDWQVEFPVLGHDGRPTPDPGGGYKHSTESFRYAVLENNAVGIVAVYPQSRADADVGPVIGAEVIAINKADGAFQVGSVGLGGAHDSMNGKCHKE